MFLSVIFKIGYQRSMLLEHHIHVICLVLGVHLSVKLFVVACFALLRFLRKTIFGSSLQESVFLGESYLIWYLYLRFTCHMMIIVVNKSQEWLSTSGLQCCQICCFRCSVFILIIALYFNHCIVSPSTLYQRTSTDNNTIKSCH